MEFTFTARGPTFDQLTRTIARDLTAAHKAAGRRIARKGVTAIRRGAPSMFGRRLSARTKTAATPTSATVTFIPSPAGPWAIAETGTRPHHITTRRREALHWAGVFAETVNHPGTAGRLAWTAAGARIAKAVEPDVIDVYDDALNGR